MIIHSPVISGSLTFADGSTLTLPPGSVYSGSFSGSYQGDTFAGGVFTGDGSGLTFNGTGIISSSAQLSADFLDTLGDGVISSSAQVEFNDVNNTPFSQSASSVTVAKSIVPTSTTIDLGTAATPFRDLYLSSASLYVDGTQVISSNTNELIITTDTNQSLKLVETGADTVQIQTENGDITFTSTGTGNIELDAPIQIVAGNQILSSDGNAIQFGEDLSITGNITLTGTVDGIDLQAFSGSVANTFAGLSTDYNDLINIPVGIVSSSAQVSAFGTFAELNGDNLVSSSAQVSAYGVFAELNGDNLVSGSSQVVLEDADKTGFTGASSITTLGTVTSGNVTAILPAGVVSGSGQIIGLDFVDLSSTQTISGDKTFSGTISVPTQVTSDDSTKAASTAFVQDRIAELIDSAPAALDTLNEIAAAIGDDPNISGSLATTISTKLAKSANLSDLSDASAARTNLSLTDSDIRGKFSAGGDLSYNSTTGQFSVTNYTDGDARTAISVTDNGGDGSLSYNSGTGVISYTGPSASEVRAHFSGGTGVTITNGSIAIGQSVGTSDTVQFGKVGVGGASDATYELKVTGDIGATGDVVAYVSSDERLKDSIELISNPIEKVQSLKGVTWEWNDNASEAAKQSPNVGVIAQDVEKVLPQLVHDRENGYKGVDYAKLTGLLIEAIKEQQKQIDDLKSKLG